MIKFKNTAQIPEIMGNLRIIDNLAGSGDSFTPEDLKAISDLVVESFAIKNTSQPTYSSDDMKIFSDFSTPDWIRSYNSRSFCVLYEEGGMITGFGALAYKGAMPDKSPLLVIQGLYSRDPQKGIGDVMLARLEAKAVELEIQKVYAHVFDFPDSICFYLNRGYKKMDKTGIKSDAASLELTKMCKELPLRQEQS